ncbi:MAG: methyl-accepting chemotaxis protein [Chlamydiales bacterium]|nr:methyl-accepting chemotaxis protein [Chlamydiales bacterium]
MFKNIKVRTRLYFMLLVASIALLAIGALGLSNGHFTRLEIDRVYHGGIENIEQLSMSSRALHQSLRQPVQQMTNGTINWTGLDASVKEFQDTFNSSWSNYVEHDSGLSTDAQVQQKMLVNKTRQQLEALTTATATLRELAQQSDKGQLQRFVDSEYYPLLDQVTESLGLLIQVHTNDTKSDYHTAMANADFYETATLVGLAVAFMILVPLTVVSIRGIVKPLEGAVEVIGVSQDIMNSLTHLSTGATETASAVTETTTTIEELKQTANISVDKAKDVLSNAEQTLQTVTSSEKSVMATIEDINQIRDRMQIISDSILKLSEKSLAIAEIMDSVSDIAEQSNLLAVNAAIESAKAGGEYGRSFGVVAQEIRTLAEQSKGATVQVRSLLNDIQQATNAAVLATEQGSKAVAKGVDQSTLTSVTIKQLVSKMSGVTQAANQIVLSNQQQLIGTEQITVAMTQINEATNQHVDHLAQIESRVATLGEVGTALQALTDKHRPQQPWEAKKHLMTGHAPIAKSSTLKDKS